MAELHRHQFGVVRRESRRLRRRHGESVCSGGGTWRVTKVRGSSGKGAGETRPLFLRAPESTSGGPIVRRLGPDELGDADVWRSCLGRKTSMRLRLTGDPK